MKPTVKRYIILVLLAIGGLSVTSEKVRLGVDVLVQIIKNLPDDLLSSTPDAPKASDTAAFP
jgi:hypothetical protein